MWRVDLDPKIAVARQLAREFNALYVPMDGLFAAASTKAAMEFWLADGVHPDSGRARLDCPGMVEMCQGNLTHLST